MVLIAQKYFDWLGICLINLAEAKETAKHIIRLEKLDVKS